MAAIVFTFDDHPSHSIRITIEKALDDRMTQTKRLSRAVRSQENRIERSNRSDGRVPSQDTDRIVLGETAIGAIHRLITVKRIAVAERAVKLGKDGLFDEVRKQKTDGSVEPIEQNRWQGLFKRLPRPRGRFGVPQVDLSPTERYNEVRRILNETQTIVKKYENHTLLPDEERQKIMRRYLGLLGEECDVAISNMNSPLPNSEELSVELLKQHGIGIKDLIFDCQIPIAELYDAQIITSLEDLELLGFMPQYLGKERSGFSVEDFVSLFGGSYTVLKKRFGLSLAMLPQRAFSARQLRLLAFNFAQESGTLENIRHMKLTPEQLADFGLTTSILTNQFKMHDIRDLSRKLGWGKSDIRAFTQRRSTVVK